MKLAKLMIEFSLSKPLWEWKRGHVRLWEKGLILFRWLILTLLLNLTFNWQSKNTLIMIILTLHLNSSTLRTLQLCATPQDYGIALLGSSLLRSLPGSVGDELAY